MVCGGDQVTFIPDAVSVQADKRYFMQSQNAGVVRGRVLSLLSNDRILVRLDNWDGIHSTMMSSILCEDNEKPGLLKRLFGMSA